MSQKNKIFGCLLSLFIIIFVIVLYLTVFPLKYRNHISAYAHKYQISPELITSIIFVESSFNPNAKSDKGAVGLMQILPSTANWICEINDIEYNEEKLLNPEYNIKIGTCYFKYLFDKFDDIEMALVAYNAGEGTVKLWLKNENYSTDGKTLKTIPYKESRNYLKKVKRAINIYSYRI